MVFFAQNLLIMNVFSWFWLILRKYFLYFWLFNLITVKISHIITRCVFFHFLKKDIYHNFFKNGILKILWKMPFFILLSTCLIFLKKKRLSQSYWLLSGISFYRTRRLTQYIQIPNFCQEYFKKLKIVQFLHLQLLFFPHLFFEITTETCQMKPPALFPEPPDWTRYMLSFLLRDFFHIR